MTTVENLAPQQEEAKKIIELFGGNAEMSKLCEITPGAVSQWLRNGIPRTQMKFLKLARPDLFPAANKSPRRKPHPPS